MIVLENNLLTVQILAKGAELCSIVDKASNTEYLWQADPEFWNKHSPILFPVVGTLRNNTYIYQGKSYIMSRHGFARDRQFTLTKQEGDRVSLELRADEATLQQYPFFFVLRIDYELAGNNLIVTYTVVNKGTETMYFSIGGHPAFNLPISNALQFEDYTLQFEQVEQADIYPLNENGQLLAAGIPFLNNTNAVALQKSLFYRDALIFKNLKSGKIRLAAEKDSRNIEVSFEQFPFLGIWSKKDADFICIEPWQGITDRQDASGLLQDKEGICALEPQQQWEASWQVTFNV
ncbi:MAG: aldose 1-epimerase family protein [Sphingobacteriales bacterium]|nr:MAG: aldose 1-epimerase family protein [Sphingobacteriales bacterium]